MLRRHLAGKENKLRPPEWKIINTYAHGGRGHETWEVLSWDMMYAGAKIEFTIYYNVSTQLLRSDLYHDL